MAKSTASGRNESDRADRIKEVVKGLEKKYGNLYLPKDADFLGLALYLVLRENWDYRKAAKALRLLQTEFVDWNELRVTSAGELRSALAPLGDKDVDVKIEKIRTLLLNLYEERNCTSLEFLSTKSDEQRRSLIESLRVFSDEQSDILAQLTTS